MFSLRLMVEINASYESRLHKEELEYIKELDVDQLIQEEQERQREREEN